MTVFVQKEEVQYQRSKQGTDFDREERETDLTGLRELSLQNQTSTVHETSQGNI